MKDSSEFPVALFLELNELIEECINGTASTQQVANLDCLIIENEQARKLYVRCIHTSCALRTWSEYTSVESLDEPGPTATNPLFR
jgi:hypothetical protein